MFDKNFFALRTKTEYVDRNINVTENRAPTDESVRLLNEFQDKAEKNLLLTGKIENNIINCQWYVIEGVTYDIKIVCALVINGKEKNIEIICDKPITADYERYISYVYDKLHQGILEELANFVTMDGIAKNSKLKIHNLFR